MTTAAIVALVFGGITIGFLVYRTVQWREINKLIRQWRETELIRRMKLLRQCRILSLEEVIMTENERRKLNADRLALIDVSIRPKVAAVISQLESRDLHPLIAKDVHRSPARQRELYNAGRTKVLWGFHNATVPGSKPPVPGSLAADIVDADLAWNASVRFWLELGCAARDHGLGWGGFFGLSAPQMDRLKRLFDRHELWGQKVQFGWDPAHIQTMTVSLADAKKGKR